LSDSQTNSGNTNSEKQALEIKRNAFYNLEEIKVRWKKAALENCTGVPCIVTAPALACGSVSSVIDGSGNSYTTVSIGTQCWTVKDLRTRKYSDGTAIPFDTSGSTTGGAVYQTWGSLTYGAHTLYAHDSAATTPSNLTNFGYLYNWYAAKGISTPGSTTYKNICPTGWHVPTNGNWTDLITQLGGTNIAGGKLKSTTLWNILGGTDDYGFTALPGGYRGDNGNFNAIRSIVFFWSATEYNLNAWNFYGTDYSSDIYSYNFFTKPHGASVRCLWIDYLSI
jgi:uncharacterized protein (TIGR02145 family)